MWLQVTDEESESFFRDGCALHSLEEPNTNGWTYYFPFNIFAETSNIVGQLIGCLTRLMQKKSSDEIKDSEIDTKHLNTQIKSLHISDHKEEETAIDDAIQSTKTEIPTILLSAKKISDFNQIEETEFGDCKSEEISMDYGNESTEMKLYVTENGDKMSEETEIDEYKTEEIKYENEQVTTPFDAINGKIEEIEFDDTKNEECKIHYEREIVETEVKTLLPLPLTATEIVNERKKGMQNILKTQNKLSKYEEKIIDIIGKQFELTYFRSPSLKEISFILSKVTQQMKKEERVRENNTRANEENMMMDYLKTVDTKRSNTRMIVDDLMSKMERHGF